MFSQTAEYALRAMSLLAVQAPRSMTTEEIAQATKVPAAYLSKVLQALKRADIVQSQRGIGGGVALAKEPAGITILDIVNAVDPIRRITSCPIGLAAHGVKLCPMHSRLDNALAIVEDALRQATLADILAEQPPRAGSCRFPRNKRYGG